MRKWLVAVGLVMLLGMVGLPIDSQAQTVVVNPTTVQFTPSPDHNGTSLDGTPLVTKYELRISLEATPATVLMTVDIGKPSPVSGTISVVNPVWFSGITPNTRYIAKVAAIGATGEGVSTASGPFGNVGPPQAPSALLVKK